MPAALTAHLALLWVCERYNPGSRVESRTCGLPEEFIRKGIRGQIERPAMSCTKSFNLFRLSDKKDDGRQVQGIGASHLMFGYSQGWSRFSPLIVIWFRVRIQDGGVLSDDKNKSLLFGISRHFSFARLLLVPRGRPPGNRDSHRSRDR